MFCNSFIANVLCMLNEINMNIKKVLKLILVILLIGAFSQEAIATDIQLKLSKDSKVVWITAPIDGNYFSGAIEEYQVDNETLDVKLDNIEKTSLIQISDGHREVYLIVEPNRKYGVDFTDAKINFYGDNAQGNGLLNSVGILNDPKYNLNDIDKLENATAKLDYITKEEIRYKKMFDELYDKQLINENFRILAYGQIKAYLETMFSTSMFFQFRLIENDEANIAKFLQDELPVWGSIYENINNKKDILQSNLMYDYTFRYIEYLDLLHYQHLIFESNHFNNMRPLLNLSGDFLEYAWAETMYVESQNNLFEKPWIDSYNDFCKTYPNSKLEKWVKPAIEQIIAYHKNAEKQDPEVVFYDKEIRSVEELGEVLKGKISYVDVWSTGCAPCRAELQYSLKNHQKMEELGIQSVYLSVDYNKQKWEEMVKSLPLKGLNILASKPLYQDLFKKITNFNGIPRYLIFGVDGKIIDDNAPRPSSEEKLFEYLEKIIRE